MSQRYETEESLVAAKMRKLSEGSSKIFFRPQDGETTIRVLPKYAGVKTFWLDIKQHFIGFSALCQKDNGHLDSCIICNYHDHYINEEDVSKQEFASRIQVKERSIVNIVVSPGTPSEINKVWEVPLKTMRDLISFYYGEYRGFDDPVSGYDFILTKKKLSKSTEYTIIPRRESTAVSTAMLEGRYDLNKAFTQSNTGNLKEQLSKYFKKLNK